MKLYALFADGLPFAAAQYLADILEACETPKALSISLVETDEERRLWGLEALYQGPLEQSIVLEFAGIAGLDPDFFSIRRLVERDWVRESLKGLKPVSAGRFFIYGSHDRHLRCRGAIKVEVDAGTAFGTGHHGSTHGCLVLLDRILKRSCPVRMIDVGTGTGVLAIALARATRRTVVATDIDPEAVGVTIGNARKNAAGRNVRAFVANGPPKGQAMLSARYDLIVANILARPLVTLAPALCRIAAPGATIVLSGLTHHQERPIRAAWRRLGGTMRSTVRSGQWSTLELVSRPAIKSSARHLKRYRAP